MIPSDFFVYVRGRTKFLKDQEKLHLRRNALLCSVIANFVPMRTKKGKVYKVDDFMPREKNKKQTAKDMYNEIVRINAMLGGSAKGKEVAK